MDIYTGSVPRKFISLHLESAVRLDQPGEAPSSIVSEQPGSRMESNSSSSETSGSLSDFFSSMETKHRASAHLGMGTSSSNVPDEVPVKAPQIPPEVHLPSLYDMPQPLQELQHLHQGSGPGDVIVKTPPSAPRLQTTPLKSDQTGRSKKRKVTISTSTQETVERLYQKKSSMVLPSDSDEVFASDNPSELQDPNVSAHHSAVEDNLSLVDIGNPDLPQTPNIPGTSSGLTHFSTLGLEQGHSDDEVEDYLVSSSRKLPGVSNSTKAVINKYFSENPRFTLPIGQPVIAFSPDQLQVLLHEVSNENSRDSYYMMKDLLLKAGELRSSDNLKRRSTAGPPRKPPRRVSASSASTDSEGQSGVGTDTSGGINTDEAEEANVCLETDSAVRRRLGLAPTVVPQAPAAPVSPLTAGTSSQSSNTPLQQIKDSIVTKSPVKTSTPRRKKRKTARVLNETLESLRRRGVERPEHILRDSSFNRIEWTRVFVSGPLDPEHNMYKFYCQLCKSNISMYGKGAVEITRHHTGETHLRRDQRWRYEHLGETNPITGQVTHLVRDKHGRVLESVELEREIPKFINAELVDLGEKYPFYSDFLAGRDHMSTGPEKRLETQLSLITNYLAKHGNLAFLKSFWDSVGTVVGRQASFSDFNWGAEHLGLIFHHLFLCAIQDISSQVISEGAYSPEFENRGQSRYLSIRFWKENNLCKVQLARCGRVYSSPVSEITLISQVVAAISLTPDIVCVSGCPLEVLMILDDCTFTGKGLHYPFRFENLSFTKLMHKRTASVFRRIDFCSVLQFLLVRLEPALGLPWMVCTSELCKVIYHFQTFPSNWT